MSRHRAIDYHSASSIGSIYSNSVLVSAKNKISYLSRAIQLNQLCIREYEKRLHTGSAARSSLAGQMAVIVHSLLVASLAQPHLQRRPETPEVMNIFLYVHVDRHRCCGVARPHLHIDPGLQHRYGHGAVRPRLQRYSLPCSSTTLASLRGGWGWWGSD